MRFFYNFLPQKSSSATGKFNDIFFILPMLIFFFLTPVIGVENCEFTFFQLMRYMHQ